MKPEARQEAFTFRFRFIVIAACACTQCGLFFIIGHMIYVREVSHYTRTVYAAINMCKFIFRHEK